MLPPNCSVAHSYAAEVATALLLLLECALGTLGNAVALWTFFFRLKVWKPYAVYLFNLVLADLLLAACLPFHPHSSFPLPPPPVLLHPRGKAADVQHPHRPACCRSRHVFKLSLSPPLSQIGRASCRERVSSPV